MPSADGVPIPQKSGCDHDFDMLCQLREELAFWCLPARGIGAFIADGCGTPSVDSNQIIRPDARIVVIRSRLLIPVGYGAVKAGVVPALSIAFVLFDESLEAACQGNAVRNVEPADGGMAVLVDGHGVQTGVRTVKPREGRLGSPGIADAVLASGAEGGGNARRRQSISHPLRPTTSRLSSDPRRHTTRIRPPPPACAGCQGYANERRQSGRMRHAPAAAASGSRRGKPGGIQTVEAASRIFGVEPQRTAAGHEGCIHGGAHPRRLRRAAQIDHLHPASVRIGHAFAGTLHSTIGTKWNVPSVGSFRKRAEYALKQAKTHQACVIWKNRGQIWKRH